VAKLRKHPLARAVRIDKVRLAGLAATLLHYVKGEAESKLPVWQMISMPVEHIENLARKWVNALGECALIIDGQSMIGGGSIPGGTIPTRLVCVSFKGGIKELADNLRKGSPSIIGRVENNKLLLDPRTVLLEEGDLLVSRLSKTLNL
jgi:L-seryl-tRNA(Ser) seleniumtransferase